MQGWVNPYLYNGKEASGHLGVNTKLIQQLTEFGQNLRATGPNELAIANVILLVITKLEQKPASEA